MIVFDLVRMALHELWSHRARSLLSLLALALAAGLIVATGSTGALLRSTSEKPAPLAGRPADFWIASAYDADYDLPAASVSRVAQVPGVAAVQPVLRRPVQVCARGSSGDCSGLGAAGPVDTLALAGVHLPDYLAFHDMDIAAGELPTAQRPGLIALAPWAFVRQVRPGDVVTLTLPTGEAALPVAGLVEVRDLASAQQGPVLYAPLDTVSELAQVDGAVTLIEVRLAPGSSARRVQAAIEEALGAAYVVSSPAQVDGGLWQQLVMRALVLIDGLVLLGSAALVYAAFASAGTGRTRRVAVLRAVGAARGHVVALLVAEAVLLGSIGGGLGLLLGLLLASVGSGLVGAGGPGPGTLPLPGLSVVLAIVLTVGSSVAGALGPVLQAARRPPALALRPDAPPRSAAVGTGSAQRVRGLARLGPGTLWVLPGVLPLAAGNLARDPRRAVLVAGALAFVLAMFLGSVGILSLLSEELATAFGRLSGGDYLLLPDVAALSLGELSGQDTSSLPPLSPALLAALDGLEDRVWVMGGTTADVQALEVFPGQPTILLDVEAYARMGAFRFHEGSWPEALDLFRQGPAVLLVPAVARRLNATHGDVVRLDTACGPVDFTVAGVGDSEFTTCVLSLSDGRVYLGANEVNAAMVKVRPGVDPGEVRGTLLSAVRTHGGTLMSLREAAGQLQDAFRQARVAMGVLVGLSGVVALLGVVSATLSSVAERREEIGLLRAVGAARPDVARLVLAEAGMIGALAAGAGTLLGWAATLLFFYVGRAQLGLAGDGLPGPGAWMPLLAATAAAWLVWPGMAMLVALVAARAAARLPILEALFGTR